MNASFRVLSVSQAQAKLSTRPGRCPFCSNKPKINRQRDGFVRFTGFCQHLWENFGSGDPEAILADPASWQGPGWPYRGGLLVSASGADSTGRPAKEEP